MSEHIVTGDSGQESAPVWTDFVRAQTVLSDGEILLHDWFVADGPPELMLRTSDAGTAKSLVVRAARMSATRAGWHRAATDAIVTQFSEEEPTPSELDDAAEDLTLQTIEVYPDGSAIVHFVDECGEHFPEGYWPAVHYDAEDQITGVTVEA